MLKIYIARHGQNLDNKNGILNGHRDEPLTSLGEEQAAGVGKEIREKGLHFDAVYSSPLKRALATAQIISKVSNQPEPIILDELIERNFGVMTGIEISKIEELCAPDILKTPTITYFLNVKGAETFPELLERARRLLDMVAEKNNAESVLLVTHGDFGKMIYTQFYGLSWMEVLSDFHFGNSEVLYLENGHNPKDARLFVTEQHNH
jgi:probable phosphoglycerate mutase